MNVTGVVVSRGDFCALQTRIDFLYELRATGRERQIGLRRSLAVQSLGAIEPFVVIWPPGFENCLRLRSRVKIEDVRFRDFVMNVRFENAAQASNQVDALDIA